MQSNRVFLAGLATLAVVMFTVGSAAAEDSLLRRDRTCVLDCRQVHSRCTQAAYMTARMCRQSCHDLVSKAREACAEAPDSEECAAARTEAAECVRACRNDLRQDLRECAADAKECLVLCPDAQDPVPADPVCLRECRRLTNACLERARAAARECAVPCADLVNKARRVCAAQPGSDECAAARREASACLQPCREQLAADTRQCIASGQRCAASCPPAVDDSAGTTRPNR